MPFKKPDCLLVRVGELALKSDPVQKRMFSMLLDNMRAALKGVKFKMEIMRNRIFVYTPDIKKATKRLQKVFGIVSVSPAWICRSDLDEIKVLASDIAKKALKLNPKKSFAIRPHRVGVHPFTTRSIAEEAGAAVKRVTNGKVNLSRPDIEMFIEVRSTKAYIFAEKIPCAGGMPLGSSGRAAAIIDGLEAVVAAWLIMKRGVEMIFFTKSTAKKSASVLKSWHIGRKPYFYSLDKIERLSDIAQKSRIRVIIGPAKVAKDLQKTISTAGFCLLQPTIGWTETEIAKSSAKVGHK